MTAAGAMAMATMAMAMAAAVTAAMATAAATPNQFGRLRHHVNQPEEGRGHRYGDEDCALGESHDKVKG